MTPLARLVAIVTGALLLLLVASPAYACSATYQEPAPGQDRTSTPPLIATLVVAGAVVTAATTIVAISVIRAGAKLSYDLAMRGILLDVAASATPSADIRPSPGRTTFPPTRHRSNHPVADQVPPYGPKGDKTTGILVLPDGRVLAP